jgi:hypothetical protein
MCNLTPMRAAFALLLAALPLAACSGYGAPEHASTELAFGVDMAKRGLWNEAIFRFQAAERAEPQNSHVQSDLAVAYEARGDFEKALDCSKKALQLTPNDKDVRANYARFIEFYQSYKAPDKSKPTKFGSHSALPPDQPAHGETPAAKPAPPEGPAAPPHPGQPQGPAPPNPLPPTPQVPPVPQPGAPPPAGAV